MSLRDADGRIVQSEFERADQQATQRYSMLGQVKRACIDIAREARSPARREIWNIRARIIADWIEQDERPASAEQSE
jgi:hypothetical protein